MKTKKTISLMLITAALTYAFTSFKNDSEKKEVIQEVNVQNNVAPSNVNYTYSLKESELEIALYDIWLKMIPDSIHWDSNSSTISYTEKKVSTEEKTEINAILNSLKIDTLSTAALPFSDNNNLATSYFIHKEDIAKINTVINNNNNKVNGVRIYMGMDTTNSHPSHVLIGPAQQTIKNADTTYTDYYLKNNAHGKHLYDLTTPCPRACANGFSGAITN